MRVRLMLTKLDTRCSGRTLLRLRGSSLEYNLIFLGLLSAQKAWTNHWYLKHLAGAPTVPVILWYTMESRMTFPLIQL